MNTKEKVLEILENHKGSAVSGEEMALALQVSRSAVWKAIRELRATGYPIEAASRRGYLLSPESDIFSPQSVLALVGDKRIRVELYEELDSTNRLVKQRGEQGEAEGLVVIAQRQTSGRGRKGRSFFSPDSGLYMSILLRPSLRAEDALLITTGAAVAVCGAIEAVFEKDCSIKWVNDIYIAGKKVCGILTEASLDFEGGGLTYACLGIGVNLTDPKGGFPQEIRNTAASLTGGEVCGGARKSRLAAEICSRFFQIYDGLPRKDFMEEYRKRSYLVGRKVTVLLQSGAREARVLDVDQNAHLLVEYQNGERQALSSGDVSVRSM